MNAPSKRQRRTNRRLGRCFGIIALIFVAATPALQAQLIGDQVTGSLQFNSDSENWFDPANGFVPSGDLNKSGTTVTIQDPGVEFGYNDGGNAYTADFSANGVTIQNVGSGGYGSAPVQYQFVSHTPGAFTGLTKTANTFSGLTYTIAGDTLTIKVPSINASAPATYSATFSWPKITAGTRYPTADDQYELQLINQARLSANGLTVLQSLVSNNLAAITPSSTETAQDGTAWTANFWTSPISQIAYAMNFYKIHPGDLKKQYIDLQLPGYPLAWNANLGDVASGYDDLVLANKGAGPGWPHNLAPYSDDSTFQAYAQRYLDGGYGPLSDLSVLAENILADGYGSAQQRFAGYMIDWGNTPDGIQNQDPNVGSHRLTLMDNELREIGIATKPGWDTGDFSNDEEFGDRFSPPPALVGAVYVDIDKNGFYTRGEGVAGVTVNAAPTAGGTTLHTRTFRSGGYVLPISKPGTYTITVTGTFGTVSGGTVTMGSVNVSRDIVCPKGQQAADFNGDNKPDYLVVYPSSGRSIIWYLNGGAWAGQADGPTVPVGWTLVGVADLNGDGYPDYLLYHPTYRRTIMYYLHGSAYVGQADGPTIYTGYSLVGLEDFNRDGQTDYLLYNATNGQTLIWYLNGTTQIGSANGPTIPAGWSVAGIADFDGDGCPDLALYNSSTQQTQIWYLDNAKKLSQANGPAIPAGWSLAGVADFDADGHPDFVIYQNTTRETQIMFLQGTTLVKTLKSQTIPANWKLISP